MKFQNLFLEEDLIKKSKNISITEKQLENFERWFEMLENERLIEEESNYNNFSDYFLKGLLNYSTENIEFQENDVEFSLKNNENKIFTLIELKGQKGDLFKKQGSGYSVSPVQQASLYADKFSDLEFFVVSNYNKFVFFSKEHKLNKKYEIDFLDFKKNNYEKLKIFLYLLSKEFTDKKIIKNEVKNYISKQNDFSKKFYKLFFETLKLLVFEIEKSNSEITRNDAVFYSQKILDRVIFTCFAEDTGIMDKDFIHKNLLDEISKNGDLWKRLNEIFRDMNKSKKDNFGEVIVPEFNGEFFKIDLENKINVIDKREINFFDKELFENYNFDKNLSDELKEKLKPYSKIFYNIFLISNFNFKTDLNVNILGQIFENSLSDIENLKNEEISKRKKDGIFYTPSYITEYICKNTIIPYLSNKGNCEIDFLIEEYSSETKTIMELEEKLTNIKILDPACGSGAFLNKAVEILNEIWEKLEELKKDKGWYNTRDKKRNFIGFDKQIQESKIKEIIKNNIFGVDLNSESCEITKLSLFLKISNKASPKLINLNENIKCGNSLISGINENNYKLFENDIKEILKEKNEDDKKQLINTLNFKLNRNLKEYFGENYKELKPFNWEIEFVHIFFEIDKNDNLIRKGFDIVIGNPPYVRHELIKEIKPYLEKNYKIYQGTADLYVYFFEKGIVNLKEKGKFAFIVSNKFSRSNYGKSLREYILKNTKFEQYIDNFKENQVFEDAVVDPCIIILEKNFTSISFLDKIKIGSNSQEQGTKLKNLFNNKKINYIIEESLDSGEILKIIFDIGFEILKTSVNKVTEVGFDLFLDKIKQIIESLKKENKKEFRICYHKDFIFYDFNVKKFVIINRNLKEKSFENEDLEKLIIEYNTYFNLENKLKYNDTVISQNSLTIDSWSFGDEQKFKILEKMKKFISLKEIIGNVKAGIKTGFNEALVLKEKKMKEIIKNNKKEEEIFVKFIKGENIKRNTFTFDKNYLILLENRNLENYQNTKSFLLQYKEKLENRSDIKGKNKKWYELRPCNFYEDFKKPKIIWPDISNGMNFTYDDKGFYLDMTCFFVNTNNKFYLCLLNSKLIEFYYKSIGSILGERGYRLKKQYIEKIPIPEISKEKQKPFIKKADLMIELNKNFYDEINFYLENLKIDLEVEKISKKLEKFYLLEKNEFLKELKKISKKIKKIEELYLGFENIKNKILEIKNKIDLEEKIIDKMVYEIYELNEDEIKIIEDS